MNKRFILGAIFGLAILGPIVTGAVSYFIFEEQARLKNRQDELQTELTKLRNKVAAESIINNHRATEIRRELEEISKTLLNLEISEWFLSEHKQALRYIIRGLAMDFLKGKRMLNQFNIVFIRRGFYMFIRVVLF